MSRDIKNHVSETNEADGFYSRWSKNKLQSKNNHQAENNTPEINANVENAQISELNQETVLLCDKDMPDLESLTEDSDYSGFLSPGVSDKLRKLALHKLFHGQKFNLCDGLDDYDEEYTSFEKLGDIVTADMRFQLEEEAKRKVQLAAEENELLDENDEPLLVNEDDSENEISTSITTSSTSKENDISTEQEDNILPNNENLS